MIANVKPSKIFPNAGAAAAIFPQSIAAAGNAVTPWVQVPVGAKWAIVRLWTGALGGGSEQVDLEQATSAGGAGAKALATNVRTSAVNNQQFDDELNIDSTLDINNGFNFIRAKVTNTGGTGALVAVGLAFGPNEFPD
jgi:hypothetical protein